MEADGLIRSVTYSISSPISVHIDDNSNPVIDPMPTTTVSPRSAISVAETVLGVRSTATSGLGAKLLGKVSGSNNLGSLLNNGAAGEASSDTPSAQIVGALGIAVLDNQVQALVNTDGSFAAEKGSIALRSLGESRSVVRADGSLYNNSTLAFIPGVGKIQITNEASTLAAGIFGGPSIWGAGVLLLIVFADLAYADRTREKNMLYRKPSGH